MPDGFYWLNDVNRYGWEPVAVRAGYFWRTGSELTGRVSDYPDSHFQWRPMTPPSE